MHGWNLRVKNRLPLNVYMHDKVHFFFTFLPLKAWHVVWFTFTCCVNLGIRGGLIMGSSSAPLGRPWPIIDVYESVIVSNYMQVQSEISIWPKEVTGKATIPALYGWYHTVETPRLLNFWELAPSTHDDDWLLLLNRTQSRIENHSKQQGWQRHSDRKKKFPFKDCKINSDEYRSI